MKYLFSLFIVCSINAANIDTFFNALGKVESSNNPRAINKKEYALGIYQIRPAYFKDSKVIGKHESVYDTAIAKKVCLAYFAKYEPQALKNNDFETLARLHNGGCGWRKNKSNTDKYWNNIKKNLR
jgi:soluble lytic murein transglycosylase-like protein